MTSADSSATVPAGYTVLDSRAFTATIYLHSDDPTRVTKAFKPEYRITLGRVERSAYERFAARDDRPASILGYHGPDPNLDDAIVLDYAPNGNLWKYMWDQREFGVHVSSRQRYQWAEQAAEALEFAHAQNILNGDIHVANFLLDQTLNLRVAGWSMSRIDGVRPGHTYRLKSRLVDQNGEDVPKREGATLATETFAFGSALYYLVAGHDLWPDLQQQDHRAEIQQLISRREFPETTGLPILGDVIRRCWNVDFQSMAEIRQAITAEARAASGGEE